MRQRNERWPVFWQSESSRHFLFFFQYVPHLCISDPLCHMHFKTVAPSRSLERTIHHLSQLLMLLYLHRFIHLHWFSSPSVSPFHLPTPTLHCSNSQQWPCLLLMLRHCLFLPCTEDTSGRSFVHVLLHWPRFVAACLLSCIHGIWDRCARGRGIWNTIQTGNCCTESTAETEKEDPHRNCLGLCSLTECVSVPTLYLCSEWWALCLFRVVNSLHWGQGLVLESNLFSSKK